MKFSSPTHEEIAKRAYAIFLARGGKHGHDRDDWLQAEYELMQLPVRKLAELPPPQLSKDPKAKMPSIVEVVQQAMISSPKASDQRQAAAR